MFLNSPLHGELYKFSAYVSKYSSAFEAFSGSQFGLCSKLSFNRLLKKSLICPCCGRSRIWKISAVSRVLVRLSPGCMDLYRSRGACCLMSVLIVTVTGHNHVHCQAPCKRSHIFRLTVLQDVATVVIWNEFWIKIKVLLQPNWV